MTGPCRYWVCGRQLRSPRPQANVNQSEKELEPTPICLLQPHTFPVFICSELHPVEPQCRVALESLGPSSVWVRKPKSWDLRGPLSPHRGEK